MKTLSTPQPMRNRAIQVLLLVLLSLGLLILGSQAFAAMAPANSVIGNQASATYVDSTATTRTSTSNTVQTTVAQVKSFLLTQSGMKSASPNQQVCYPHTVTNTGNGSDTYALNAPTTGGMFAHTSLAYYLDADQNGAPDNGSAITASGPLAAGAAFNFVVCGTTPVGATVGQQGTIIVSATDTNAPTANTQSQTDTTTIAVASITVAKRLSSVPPPGYTPVPSGPSPNAGPLYVILDYVNSGTVQGDNVQITDVLPSGWLYVPGSGRWSGSGMSVLTDAAGGDPVGITYSAPAMAVSGTIAATVTAVSGSTSGNLYFQITIAPNLAVTVPGNQAVTTNTASYQYSYTYFNAVTMMNQTVMVPSTNTNSVLYSVLPVAGVVANGSSSTTGATDAEPVTVAGAGAGQTISWTDYIWNTGNGVDTFDIALLNTPLNGSGCAVTNNAMLGQCTFPVGTTFQILAAGGMTTLLDSNMNSTPDTGPIPMPSGMTCPAPYIASTSMPARCGLPIVITATIPAGAPAGNNGGNGFQVLVGATSSVNPTVTESVPNRLNAIAAATVDLTNNVSVVGGAVVADGLGPDNLSVITSNSVTPAVAASTTTRFRLHVNNTSTVAQIYNLSGTFVSVPVGVGLSTPPAGWTIAFRDDGGLGNCTTVGGTVTSTGAVPIAPAGNRLICAEVVVPSTNSSAMGTPTLAPPGNYVLQFRAEQQSDNTVFDTKRDQITVQPVHSVTITPNGAQSTVPGGAVTYTHAVTNSGNVSESITFPTAGFLTNSQVPTYAWSTTAYVDTNMNGMLDIGTDTPIAVGMTTFMLPPNGSQTVFVRVNAPAMAGSPPNVTTLTATYNAGGSTASANDTTTLTDGLKLDKYQQLPAGTGSCTTTPAVTLTMGVPNAPWSNMAIAASANTVPGRCISYLIVGTNTTAANITNINVSDLVPAHTALDTGCGAPAVTGPIALTGGPYATGYTGMVTAASSPLTTTPLPPATSFTLQFCVKINDI
ncbi:MAG: hypothetical protein JNK75_06295 [Betaproteobacteria bacterium]|nr:hypothetical protein [Betaproteobacteria bacterium]